MLVKVFSTLEKCADLVVPTFARIALHPRFLVGVVEHVSRVFGLRSLHHIYSSFDIGTSFSHTIDSVLLFRQSSHHFHTDMTKHKQTGMPAKIAQHSTRNHSCK